MWPLRPFYFKGRKEVLVILFICVHQVTVEGHLCYTPFHHRFFSVSTSRTPLQTSQGVTHLFKECVSFKNVQMFKYFEYRNVFQNRNGE